MSRLCLVVSLSLALLAPVSRARAQQTPIQRAIAYRASHEGAIVRELEALLRLPNTASDSSHIRANARALVAALQARGVRTRVLEAPGAEPAVVGELPSPGARTTVMLYAHYDGQPADPRAWATPPFTPTLREGPGVNAKIVAVPDTGEIPADWRVFARSAGDDKGAIAAMLAALDAVRASGAHPSVNLEFFFEGGEEAGSPNLQALLERNATLLHADLWIFCDGPMHPSGRPQLIYGVRGQTSVEITTYGPLRALHDGHYGNWAPNPASELVTLLARLRDPDAHIHIDHFYDDVAPVTAADRAAIAELPRPDSALRAELAIARPEGGADTLAARLMLPALNIRGLAVGAVGAAATNAIQPEAHASVDFRLVPNETPAHIRALVERQLTTLGYTLTHDAPDSALRATHAHVVRLEWSRDAYGAFRTSLDDPYAARVYEIVRRAYGTPVYRVPMLGGSLPASIFVDALHAPSIVLPIANYDDSQHAANENLRLGNLWNAVDLFARLYLELGAPAPR